MWNIGDINIKNKVALAPMAGISNPAYFKIVEELGCSLAVTELISSEAIIRNNKKTFDMLNGILDVKIPVGVQLFGSDPDVMGRAAKIIVDKYPNVFIDINMGCPVPKVALRSEAGSGLLKNIDLIEKIVTSVVNSVDVPVTAKIRIGWDSNSINAVLVAKTIEKAGASMICVHGRTRSQGYTGKANLDYIKAVKNSVSIPVIGNGDIVDITSAKYMLDYTGVDAIMIGRAALGNPWIFREIVSYLEDGTIVNKPTDIERIDMCLKHLNNLKLYKNEKTAVLEIRSHIAWYLKGMKNSSEIKNKIFLMNNIFDIIDILNDYKNFLRNEG